MGIGEQGADAVEAPHREGGPFEEVLSWAAKIEGGQWWQRGGHKGTHLLLAGQRNSILAPSFPMHTV